MMKRIVFRTDASLQMGSGHIMRCLTLADALQANGAQCHFISREHPGNLIEQIKDKGHSVHALSGMNMDEQSNPARANSFATAQHIMTKDHRHSDDLAYAHWLGATQQQDAAECELIVNALQPDWLIADHYALDARWEKALRPYCRKLMVIDDLADRPHICDLLLDQTFGRSADDYKLWVPAGCALLCGSQYALLRPEFSALRSYSLKRRENPQLEHLLITMGGVDKDNATVQVLEAIRHCALPTNCRITVVMGASAPWIDEVRRQAEQMPWPTVVRINISDMAQLMADSDLSIGAAGSTSWERCCLGLPTVMIVLADNQQQLAQGLEHAGAVHVLQPQQIIDCLPAVLGSLVSTSNRVAMSQAASFIADGSGVAAVIQHLEY